MSQALCYKSFVPLIKLSCMTVYFPSLDASFSYSLVLCHPGHNCWLSVFHVILGMILDIVKF